MFLYQPKEYYKVYVGIRCKGSDIKFHEADSIHGCNEACDALPNCVGYVHKDDFSRGGCYLKTNSCWDNITSKPGLSLFVRSSKYLCLCVIVFIHS